MSTDATSEPKLEQDIFVSAPEDPKKEPEPEKKPIAIELFGERYTFTSPEEMARTIEGVVNQIRLEAEARVAQAKQPAQADAKGSYVTGAEQPQALDTQKFLDLLEKKGPVAAVEEAIRHSRVGQAINQMMTTMANIVLAQEAQRFVEATPEYEPNDANMRALLRVLKENNLPPTSQGFRAAFKLAVDQNLIKPREPAQTPSAPPSPGRGVSTGPAIDWNKVRSMSSDELKARIEQLKAQMGRSSS